MPNRMKNQIKNKAAKTDITDATAIILAAGKSSRMNGTDKTTEIVAGKPLIFHAITPFLKSKNVKTIIVACNAKNKNPIQKIFPVKSFPNIQIILGGKTRFQSAKKAFQHLETIHKKSANRLAQNHIILFHNAANVLCTTKEIDDTIEIAKRHGACIVARPASDTLKKINKNTNMIEETIDREKILHAETPQTFRYDIIKKAYENFRNFRAKNNKSPEITDESSLVEATGHTVHWISASPHNRKITTHHDLAFVKHMLEKTTVTTRHGIATDSHFFESRSKSNHARHLKLCGITIANIPKLSADSDGDVALHALTAAISQAIGGGSLGTFATTMCKKGVTDSKKYLEKILDELTRKQLTIKHIGLHFECNKPKIDTLTPKLKNALSKLLHVPRKEIGITASSGKLKINPKKDGIHCTAIVTIK